MPPGPNVVHPNSLAKSIHLAADGGSPHRQPLITRGAEILVSATTTLSVRWDPTVCLTPRHTLAWATTMWTPGISQKSCQCLELLTDRWAVHVSSTPSTEAPKECVEILSTSVRKSWARLCDRASQAGSVTRLDHKLCVPIKAVTPKPHHVIEGIEVGEIRHGAAPPWAYVCVAVCGIGDAWEGSLGSCGRNGDRSGDESPQGAPQLLTGIVRSLLAT